MEEVKALLSALDPSKPIDEIATTLSNLALAWYKLAQKSIRVTEHLKGNTLFVALTKVMEANYETWKDNYPAWISQLTFSARMERDIESELFPLEHMISVEKIHRKYFLNGGNCVESYRQLAAFHSIKDMLLQDDDVYNTIKANLQDKQISFLYTLAGSDEWEAKMLHDNQLILQLLSIPEDSDSSQRKWNLLISLAKNPDAKSLLPKEVLLQVNQSKYIRRMELCALLCQEADLKVLQMDMDWVTTISNLLGTLLNKGVAVTKFVAYNLVDVVLPIANLSTVEAMKETLGTRVLPLLIKLIVEVPPDTIYTTKHIARARQEASKAVWNLAYLESNRALIAKDTDKLSNVLSSTSDPIFKKNISGILYMFSNNPAAVAQKTEEKQDTPTRGHIMLSYNWGNQPIVKRIAKEMKDRGYNVWLDVEHMEGSTLEAMASAIEHSALVLVCMSQKYKDSPNCRLEGEYCVNRKVPYIPLMMQKNYRPDGWLGIALGSKLYYEFDNEEEWDFKIASLVKAVGNLGKATSQTTIPAIPAPVPQTTTEWTDGDLLHWMKGERIDQHYDLFKKHKLGKRALLELQRRDNREPTSTFFFNSFERLGVSEFGEILLLSAAIHNLK